MKSCSMHPGTFSWSLQKSGDPLTRVAATAPCFIISRDHKPHKVFIPDDNGKSIDVPDQLIRILQPRNQTPPVLPEGEIAETIEVPGALPSELPHIDVEVVSDHLSDSHYRKMLLQFLAASLQAVRDYEEALTSNGEVKARKAPDDTLKFWETEASKAFAAAKGAVNNLKGFLNTI